MRIPKSFKKRNIVERIVIKDIFLKTKLDNLITEFEALNLQKTHPDCWLELVEKTSYNDSTYMDVVEYRLETDEELVLYWNQEIAMKKLKEGRERDQLALLKAKYET